MRPLTTLLDGDRWREILEPLRTSKLRTAATALSVAWGIFMLVILLGAGQGLQNGVEQQFRHDAVNSIWIWDGRTSKPHRGYGAGRDIKFQNRDYEAVRSTTPEIEYASGRYELWGEFTVRYGKKVSNFSVRACHPGDKDVANTQVTEGRVINRADVRERRKVAIIGPQVVEQLFDGKDAMGEWISVRGTLYRVVGVFDDEGHDREFQPGAHVPQGHESLRGDLDADLAGLDRNANRRTHRREQHHDGQRS